MRTALAGPLLAEVSPRVAAAAGAGSAQADHAKAAVSSRGELVAKIFADYYEPLHSSEITRAHTHR